MSNDVSVGKPMAAGGIFAGDPDDTLPVDATTALGVDFDNLGLVSEDGLTNSIEVDSENIVEWGGNTVLTIKTSRSETFAWTFIETNALVLSEVYGPQNVVVGAADALTVIHNADDLPRRAYIFEILMTGNKVKRIVVPNGQITEIGDVVYVAGEAIGYEVTLSCFPDSAGNTVYEFIAEITGE